MKTIALCMMSLLMVVPAYAGTSPAVSMKNPVGPMPEPPACFGPGFDVGIFGGGFLPRHGSHDYDDSLGGGVLADYFFCKNFGIQLSYGAFATSGTQHLFNGDLVLRAPLESLCIAPYLLVGGGFHVDGDSVGEYHVGAGLECKFRSDPRFGIFADGTYNWHSSSNRDRDFTLVRVGVKFSL